MDKPTPQWVLDKGFLSFKEYMADVRSKRSLTKNEASTAPRTAKSTKLGPAGHKRKEKLKQRDDTLVQAAEELSASQERVRFDPSKLKIDNEVVSHFGLDGEFNELEVSKARPDWAYCWVWTGQSGLAIKKKMTEFREYTGRRDAGWEVIQGDREEAMELKGVHTDTTRRMPPDTILMGIKRWAYDLLVEARQHKADVRSGSVGSQLEEIAEQARRKHPSAKGLKVHTNIEQEPAKYFQERSKGGAGARV